MNSRLICTVIAGVATAALTFSADAGDAVKGKVIYDGIGACSACHGPEGKGDGVAAAALDPKPRKFSGEEFKFDTDGDGKTGTATDLENVVTHGATKYGGSLMMAARADIKGDDLKNLIAYVQQLAGK